MTAPAYKIEGPALISFSGGRTSAYMLRQILDAWDGTLPDDVHVCFANTGKEREETLRFVHECETNWGVRVHWLERAPKEDGGFREVGYNSASRKGEPFAELIGEKSYLPNAVTRFCTSALKVEVMRAFGLSLGFTHWANVIGLRYDEGHRCLKAYARNAEDKEPFKAVLPLDKARVLKRDVMAFWAAQPFDLQLRPYEGNCDLCFLKSRGKLLAIMREQPGAADWWIEQERLINGRFITEHSYAQLAEAARRQQVFPFLDDEEHDAECGLVCAP
jgi:3'-phosphoadenosine 5'-phosphosulfate sulfotransferase (PAPS reductase)/FAD synthetase